MSRRTIHQHVLRVGLATSLACGGAAANAEPRSPNVVILLTDDQRASAVGSLGNPDVLTPTIDQLLERGVSFTNTYITGSHRPAVCAPSRASLLTGRHYFTVPASIGGQCADDACDITSFPEVFRAAGYETFGTGKWHSGRPLFARGFTDGGSIFFGGMANHLKTPVYDFDPTGRYPGDARHVGESFSSVLFTDAAIDFLERRNASKPFLMYVSYTAPHDPRMAPEPYASMYDAAAVKLPPNFRSEHPFRIAADRIRDEMLAAFPRTPEEAREHIAAYYAMVTHVDAQMGRLVTALEDADLLDNTYIVFASDNGLAVGQHGLLGKQNLYDHSAKVPLVISGPGIPENERREGLCYLHDIFPTICDLAGLPIPEEVEMPSLVPMIRDRYHVAHEGVYLTYASQAVLTNDDGSPSTARYQRGLRMGDYKVIQSRYDGDVYTLLFNLRDDPWELDNLADDPAHRERLETMIRRMGDEAVALGDAAPPPVMPAPRSEAIQP
jgi:arylsulfatase A-like enzyme